MLAFHLGMAVLSAWILIGCIWHYLRQRPVPFPPRADSKTHDYTERYWGHDITGRQFDKKGHLHLVGWGYGIRRGDFLRLPQNGSNDPLGRKNPTYRVRDIQYYLNPPDMWRAVLLVAEGESMEQVNGDRRGTYR